MNNYRIQFKSSAAKECKKLPLFIKQRVSEIIDKLQQNSRPSGVVKLKGDDLIISGAYW